MVWWVDPEIFNFSFKQLTSIKSTHRFQWRRLDKLILVELYLLLYICIWVLYICIWVIYLQIKIQNKGYEKLNPATSKHYRIKYCATSYQDYNFELFSWSLSKFSSRISRWNVVGIISIPFFGFYDSQECWDGPFSRREDQTDRFALRSDIVFYCLFVS